MQYSIFRSRPRATRWRLRLASCSALVAVFSIGALVALLGGAAAAVKNVPLGTADRFAVLAGAGISNTGPSVISGDVGTYATTSIDGDPFVINGKNQGGNGVTQQAKIDLANAIVVAAGEVPPAQTVADITGMDLPAGIYNSASTILLTGAVTLNGHGDRNAIFVFQAGSALTTMSGSVVNLVNGAQSCNVYWVVGSDATLGTFSTFRGNLLVHRDLTVTTGVNIHGRVLADTGAVTLDTDTITRSTCSTPPPADTPTVTVPTTPDTTTTATTPVTTTTAAETAAKAKAAAAKKAAAKKKAAAAKAAALKKLAAKNAAAKKAAAARKGGSTSTTTGHARLARRSVGFTG
jgi:hypothetical protein